MIIKQANLENYLKDNTSIYVDTITWSIRLMDSEKNKIGAVRFDTFLKLDLKKFDKIKGYAGWIEEYKLKDGMCDIYKY